MKTDKQKFILRIILSPLIFIWGILMLMVGSLFPLPLLVTMSIVGVISTPFTWLLRQSGSSMEYMEPFICDSENENIKMIMWGHFLGMTIYFWGAPAIVYQYITTGEIFTGE